MVADPNYLNPFHDNNGVEYTTKTIESLGVNLNEIIHQLII